MNTAIRWFQNSRDERKLFDEADVTRLVAARIQARQKASSAGVRENPGNIQVAQAP
jgi:hypothetical protein